MSASPTWPQVAGWLATAQPVPSRGTATVQNGDVPVLTRFRFVHRLPHALRIELPDGTVVLQDGGSAVTVAPDGSVHDASTAVAGAVRGLLDGRRTWSRSDFHRPAGEVQAVTWAGRPAWRVLLEPPPGKVGPLELVVDDETGLLLREAGLAPDAPFVVQVDTWTPGDVGDVPLTHLGHAPEDARRRGERRRQQLQELVASLPIVRSWPLGVPPRLIRTSPEGTVIVELRLPTAGDNDGCRIQLAAAPADGPAPDLTAAGPVTRWVSGGRSYALHVDGRELTPDELERVKAGVVVRPVDGW